MMTSAKRRNAIRKVHKSEYKQRIRRLKKALEQDYLKLKAQNPSLPENELDALFLGQQRRKKVAAKEKYENKQAKRRKSLREKNAKAKPSTRKGRSIRTVQGGRVSPR